MTQRKKAAPQKNLEACQPITYSMLSFSVVQCKYIHLWWAIYDHKQSNAKNFQTAQPRVEKGWPKFTFFQHNLISYGKELLWPAIMLDFEVGVAKVCLTLVGVPVEILTSQVKWNAQYIKLQELKREGVGAGGDVAYDWLKVRAVSSHPLA